MEVVQLGKLSIPIIGLFVIQGIFDVLLMLTVLYFLVYQSKKSSLGESEAISPDLADQLAEGQVMLAQIKDRLDKGSKLKSDLYALMESLDEKEIESRKLLNFYSSAVAELRKDDRITGKEKESLIYEMVSQGYTSDAIANRLKMTVGEVELMIRLTSNRQE